MKYYKLLDQLVDEMTSLEDFNIPRIYAVMAELCKLLRVAKGVTIFYANPEQEKLGRGEEYVCYDSGEPKTLVSREKIVTPTMMMVACEVYIAEGQDPWTEEEWERINRIQRIMLTFINRSRLSAEVTRLTFYDGDGYKNMRYLIRHMQQHPDTGGKAAVRLNLRHFSVINQQVGRSAGNVLMRNYIGALEEVAGEGGMVIRLGGDNFVLLCEQERLPQVIPVLRGIPVVYDKSTGARTVVASIAGVFEIQDSKTDLNEIMNHITSAYESAKTGGKEEVVFCNPQVDTMKAKVKRIQQIFPAALKNREFLVYYQPKIDVTTGELTGAEALCRWQHKGELIAPGEFVPILEQNLDICKLDFYMLDQVCRDIRRWMDEGRRLVRVSVNLSRKNMVDADLSQHIIEIVDRNKVPHKYIEIELTETTTDVEFRDLKKIVYDLQSEGICTSVDDFGIGYSSMNLLRAVPWNVLKVDKTFLPDAKREDKDNIMFRHVIAMARDLGLECIAEGVETRQQVNILQDNGCDLAQGFYFDKPLPVADFEDRLTRHHYDEDGQPLDEA